MKIRLPILVLSMFVCLRAHGALSVAFNGPSMTVTVPAGHSVAWVVHENRFRPGITADTDNDGQVVIPIAQYSPGVIVADVVTGNGSPRLPSAPRWGTIRCRPQASCAGRTALSRS